MGKRSVRENKNMYQQLREQAGLTRDAASELCGCISADRIEKIEGGRSPAHPDEVPILAACYKAPELCSWYCANECELGRGRVPELKEQELSQIVLSLLSLIGALEKERDRLIEITVDGRITADEAGDFSRIRSQLAELSAASSSLSLWVEKSIADGELDGSLLTDSH